MKRKSRSRWIRLFLLTQLITLSRADVSMPAIFSDHAVLQKSDNVPVWGRAASGEHVAVAVGDANAETNAGTDGRWRVTLDLLRQKSGPFDLIVTGRNRLVISDVLVGEVWLCSGQSNMEWQLRNCTGAKEEMAQAANPHLRHFLVKKKSALAPMDDCEGQWTVAGPHTSGDFTAVGYYFGLALQKQLNVPVGLINSSWGGTNIERWISSEGTDPDAELKGSKDCQLAIARKFAAQFPGYVAKYHAWETKYGRQDQPAPNPEAFAAPGVSTKDWKPVPLPGPLGSQTGLPDAGVIWLRRTITVSRDWAGFGISLETGRNQDFDAVYWNGKKLAETTAQTPGSASARRYWVPDGAPLAGENTLAIRLFSPGGGAGVFAGKGAFHAGIFDLTGEWLAKAERELPPLDAEARVTYVRQPEMPFGGLDAVPTSLFNGMIHPLVPYALRGAIWYQGESNVVRADQYRTALPLLIQDWRRLWGRGDFTFYICQLANFKPKQDLPGESDWAELREAQARALSLPQTGIAVLIDLGEERDVHFRNKKPAGERLAFLARAQTYGEKIPYSGPMYQAMNATEGKVRLNFRPTAGGLVARPLPESYQPRSTAPDTRPLVRHSPGGELEGFAICGADRQWKWASAKIDGDTVVVWSPDVPAPVAVRYAWADNPTCNLYNGVGLPAAPFRTDDFPLTTRNTRY